MRHMVGGENCLKISASQLLRFGIDSVREAFFFNRLNMGIFRIGWLHPQYLDGIWIGQDEYRMPLVPLSEYPEPWFWKIAGRGI